MFWKIEVLDGAEKTRGDAAPDGRYVLHRHHDAAGEHLDLRLEADGYLVGYRIGGVTLEDGAWATEKMPHPLAWLEQDRDAVREEAGTYAWRYRGEDCRELELHGPAGARVLRVSLESGLDAGSARAIAEALRGEQTAPARAAALIRDGAVARRRAVERFCGLGRELDGRAFDEPVWRKTLEPLALEEIQQHLQGYEVRFDAKYPPEPTSVPEPLEDDDGARVLALARG